MIHLLKIKNPSTEDSPTEDRNIKNKENRNINYKQYHLFENKEKNYKIHHLKFEISRTTLQNPSTEVQKQEKSKRKYETNKTEGLKKP